MMPKPSAVTFRLYDTSNEQEYNAGQIASFVSQIDLKDFASYAGINFSSLESKNTTEVIQYLIDTLKIAKLFPYLHEKHPELFEEKKLAMPVSHQTVHFGNNVTIGIMAKNIIAGTITVVNGSVNINDNRTVHEGDNIEIKDSVINRSDIGSKRKKGLEDQF